MLFTPDLEHQIIGNIYDAALQPELWPRVLHQISEYWAAPIVNLGVGDRLNPGYIIVHSHGATEEMQKLYVEGGFAEPDMKLAMQWCPPSSLGVASGNHQAFDGIHNWKNAAGDLYTNFYAKANILYQLGTMLELTDFRYAYLGLSRSEQDGAFDDEQVACANKLTPHIRRALQIHRQLTHVRKHNVALYSMLDNMVAGVLLLDNNGRVCYANPAAELLLSQHNALSMSARYGLKVANENEWRKLNLLIQGAIKTSLRERHRLSPDTTPAGGVLGISTADGAVPLMLTVTPISEMSGYEDLASDNIAASIFLTNPKAHRVLARNLLQTAYALSERECDICEAFLNSSTLEGVANTLDITVTTVRSYMKDIYQKTNHRSQAELMRLLTGLTIEFEHIR